MVLPAVRGFESIETRIQRLLWIRSIDGCRRFFVSVRYSFRSAGASIATPLALATPTSIGAPPGVSSPNAL